VEAVVTFAGVDKVYVIENGAAREARVTLGARKAADAKGPGGKPRELIEVLTGLKGGEQVAVSGTNRLANGVPVEVKAGGPSTAPATQPAVAPRGS
jgi:hypothetical protein